MCRPAEYGKANDVPKYPTHEGLFRKKKTCTCLKNQSMKKKHTSTIASISHKKDYIPIVATILITPICHSVPVKHYSIMTGLKYS